MNINIKSHKSIILCYFIYHWSTQAIHPLLLHITSFRHAQNPLSGERKKTLLITHHALSTPPSHHHLYIIHFINWIQRFYRITMSLKRPFVLKSDVKQWFTTYYYYLQANIVTARIVTTRVGYNTIRSWTPKFLCMLCKQHGVASFLTGWGILIIHLSCSLISIQKLCKYRVII